MYGDQHSALLRSEMSGKHSSPHFPGDGTSGRRADTERTSTED